MPETSQTLGVIRDILNEKLDIEPEKVTSESTFETLGIDSIDMVELVCELEDRLDIDFGDPEGIQTVEQLVDYIDTL